MCPGSMFTFLNWTVIISLSLFNPARPVNAETIPYKIHGSSMHPLVKHGDEVDVLVDVQPVKANDLVVFRVGNQTVIKKVAGVPGDHLDIAQCEDAVGTENLCIYINGEAARSPSSKPYKLEHGTVKLVRMYTGVLSGYFVLGREGTYDSSKFGPISQDAIIGVVIGKSN